MGHGYNVPLICREAVAYGLPEHYVALLRGLLTFGPAEVNSNLYNDMARLKRTSRVILVHLRRLNAPEDYQLYIERTLDNLFKEVP